jgi:starch phosphorylase
MSRLTPQFSANRVVRQYTQDYYLPAASAYRARAAQHVAMGRAIADWQRMLRDHWGAIRFGKLNIATNPDTHTFELEIYLGAVPGDCVRVELYANGQNGSAAIKQVMAPIRTLVGAANSYAYVGNVPANRPAPHYTPRIIPHRAGVGVPLEAPEILWQR